jgi:CheY-like chemotaxis protein
MDERTLHILLVDDDEVDVMTVRRAFERNHITNPLHTASDGLDALQKLRDGSIGARRIVLLDLNMPKMNGIEFLSAVRADPALKCTSIVVLTTSSEERDKIEAYKRNVAGYFVKPVTFTRFVDVMAALDRYWTLVEMP